MPSRPWRRRRAAAPGRATPARGGGRRFTLLNATATHGTAAPVTLAIILRHPTLPPTDSTGRRALVTLAAWLLCLSGCALTPPQPPAKPEAPAAWATATTDDALAPRPARALEAAWWSRFGDPLLTDLVRQALQANTSVQSAQAALRQARALREAAAAGLLPAVGSSASAQRSAARGQDAGSSFQLGLDASWELDLFGARRSALAASNASARASEAGLGGVQVSIAAEVALGYIGLRGAQARLTIAEDNLASQLETLQITRWRLQAGLVGALEAEQALSAAEQTRATLPPLRTSIAQSSHALAVLTGQYPGALTARLAARQPVPQPDASLLLSLPAETLRQRPDVRAAEHRLAAEVARLAQADAARLPAFKLGGSLGLQALTLGALSNGAAVVGSLLAGVTLPVFDGGALRAQVAAQQAVLDQSVAAYRASVLSALQEVEDALIALAGDQARAARLQAAAQAASNAALMASQRYSSGLVDFQVVLDTQRSQLATQESLAIAGSNLAADQVRLYKALGGGWRASTDSNTAIAGIAAPAAAANTGPAANTANTAAPANTPPDTRNPTR